MVKNTKLYIRLKEKGMRVLAYGSLVLSLWFGFNTKSTQNNPSSQKNPSCQVSNSKQRISDSEIKSLEGSKAVDKTAGGVILVKKQDKPSKVSGKPEVSGKPDRKSNLLPGELIPRTIIDAIGENQVLAKEAAKVDKSPEFRKESENLIEQMRQGNLDPGIGSRTVKGLKQVSEARGRKGTRVYFEVKEDNSVRILAKSNKNKKSQNKVIKALKTAGYDKKRSNIVDRSEL